MSPCPPYRGGHGANQGGAGGGAAGGRRVPRRAWASRQSLTFCSCRAMAAVNAGLSVYVYAEVTMTSCLNSSRVSSATCFFFRVYLRRVVSGDRDGGGSASAVGQFGPPDDGVTVCRGARGLRSRVIIHPVPPGHTLLSTSKTQSSISKRHECTHRLAHTITAIGTFGTLRHLQRCRVEHRPSLFLRVRDSRARHRASCPQPCIAQVLETPTAAHTAAAARAAAGWRPMCSAAAQPAPHGGALPPAPPRARRSPAAR